jgi:hypothetical protein
MFSLYRKKLVLCDHDPNMEKMVKLYMQCSTQELTTMLGTSSTLMHAILKHK